MSSGIGTPMGPLPPEDTGAGVGPAIPEGGATVDAPDEDISFDQPAMPTVATHPQTGAPITVPPPPQAAVPPPPQAAVPPPPVVLQPPQVVFPPPPPPPQPAEGPPEGIATIMGGVGGGFIGLVVAGATFTDPLVATTGGASFGALASKLVARHLNNQAEQNYTAYLAALTAAPTTIDYDTPEGSHRSDESV